MKRYKVIIKHADLGSVTGDIVMTCEFYAKDGEQAEKIKDQLEAIDFPLPEINSRKEDIKQALLTEIL